MTARGAKPVLDGRRIKWTLETAQSNDPGRVRLDWLRFTLPLAAVVDADDSLPADWDAVALMDQRSRDVVREARGTEAEYTTGPAVARSAARQLLARLPQGFTLGTVEARGMDYYTARATVLFDGAEVGQVLAGGKQMTQAGTVHFNLHGAAMLRLIRSDYRRLHAWISHAKGWITRVDLALDFFGGHDIAAVREAYLLGEFDVRGKRPGQREIGAWTNGHSRTFEVGSRDTGKLFRGYEKGHEQFGPESADEWVRYEVEFRNNNRIIDLSVLENPADYFAGSYAFCARVLAECAERVNATAIKTKTKLEDATADAAALRLVKFVKRTCAPSVAALLRLGGDVAEKILTDEAWRVPARLIGWADAAVSAALEKIAAGFAPPAASSC